MKSLLLIPIFLLLFSSCSEILRNKKKSDTALHIVKAEDIPVIEVLKKELTLNQLEGKWYFNDKPYSGFSLRFYPNDTLAEKLGYINGKREGIAKKYSENGVLRIESFYKNNRLDSIYKSWWENGVLSAQATYDKNIKQGVEKEWYANGQLAKERQLVDGKENGLQRAWLENGTLYVNYEAKNGRIFGMRRANSCFKLEDEKVIRN